MTDATASQKQYRIEYTSPLRQKEVVSGARFSYSGAYWPVLGLGVNECIEGRYKSAGYKRITRIA